MTKNASTQTNEIVLIDLTSELEDLNDRLRDFESEMGDSSSNLVIDERCRAERVKKPYEWTQDFDPSKGDASKIIKIVEPVKSIE